MSGLNLSVYYLKVIKSNEDTLTRDFIAATTDVAQTIGELLNKYKIELPDQFVKVVSGKIGAVVSAATLFDKISRDEDTLSDWLGASSDIALIIAGYTGNPIIAGTATVLGIASILTSDLAVGMAKGYLNAVQKYGLVDPDTGGWLLPPGYINEPSLGPDMSIPETTTSPIILDLDGDGIETRSLQDGIFFDHDGNHFAENTGWVSADDGLLVIDKDGNGKIDSGNELFGNNTVLSNGSLAANGYEALQELDTNGDGTLNSRDEAWQQLQVWQDRNGNARVDDGELMSLSEAGIAAIDTDYKNSTWVDKQGNAHKQIGEVIYLDGSEGQSADVWFDVDKGYTSYTLDIVVPQSVRALPWVRGFGNMTDLHVAMSLNSELQAMVEQYIVDPLNSQALLQDIIFTWAGVADIAADSRGENIDARRLSVLEKATGENYQNKVNGTTDPLKNAAVLLEDEYKRFSDFIEASLLSQTLYRDDFATISLTMKSDYSGLTLNFDDFASHLESIKLTDVNEYLHLRKTFYALFEYSPSYSDVREQLGIPSEQSFFGDDGNNTFSGSKMNDYIWGNKGDDTLKGGYGSDTYLFNAGDGKDYLYEGTSNAGDADTLRFGEGINPEDVIIQRRKTSGLNARDSLIITFRDSTDSITLDDFFRAAKYQVEHITFADGTDWLPEDILNYLEDEIPLPIAAPPDTPVSMSLLRQEMAAFSGGV